MSLIHETFRDVAPVAQLTRQKEEDNQPGEYVFLKGKVDCVEDDNEPLLNLSNIPRSH